MHINRFFLILISINFFTVPHYKPYSTKIINSKAHQILSEMKQTFGNISLLKTEQTKILQVYTHLLSKCRVKNIVPIFNDNCPKTKLNAYYSPYYHAIVLTKNFHKSSPSVQVFTLLHEIRHALQSEKKLSGTSFDKERDADTFALSKIKCGICAYICALHSCSNSSKGYLTKTNILHHANILQLHAMTCKDHKNDHLVKILLNAQNQNDTHAISLDTKHGNIFNRLF